MCLRKGIAVGLGVVLVGLVAQTAAAQRAEVTGFVGYTLSEGINVDPNTAVGALVKEVNPKSGASWGLGVGAFLTENAEVGFQWAQQSSKLEATLRATGKEELANMKVNNYHGIFTQNVGDSRNVVRPFFYLGLGATNYSPDPVMGTNVDSLTKFSTTWGGGVKAYPNPRVGVILTARWTPTYIKSDPAGYYCTPYWPGGCVLLADADYSHQFEISGGIGIRF